MERKGQLISGLIRWQNHRVDRDTQQGLAVVDNATEVKVNSMAWTLRARRIDLWLMVPPET